MRDPATIHHPHVGSAVVPATAVPTWERAGWSTKPPTKRAPKTPAPRPAPTAAEPSAATAPTE